MPCVDKGTVGLKRSEISFVEELVYVRRWGQRDFSPSESITIRMARCMIDRGLSQTLVLRSD